MTLLAGLRQLAGRRAPAPPARWVVVDVETSGLDPARDRLLSIAGIAVLQADARLVIAIGDSFEIILQQPEAPPAHANVLIHGIGVGAQRGGIAPRAGLTAFEDWLGESPLIAFHAAFDQQVIQRAMRAVLGRQPANPWVDLAPVARALHPQAKARTLDQWLAQLHLICESRHRAAADALATAELLLKLWPTVRAQAGGAAPGLRSLRRLAAQGRWLQR